MVSQIKYNLASKERPKKWNVIPLSRCCKTLIFYLHFSYFTSFLLATGLRSTSLLYRDRDLKNLQSEDDFT